MRLILGEGVRVIGGGVALGLVAAALTARALGSLMPLYGVGPTDPLTYATVPALLLGVALLAAHGPRPPGAASGSECGAATGIGAWAADIQGIRDQGSTEHRKEPDSWILSGLGALP